MGREKPPLKGTLRVPGDKSISHRALIFSVLARGNCEISGLSPAEDVRATARCLKALGVEFNLAVEEIGRAASPPVVVKSPGLDGLRPSPLPLDAGNSGTTMRLLAGLAAGRPFATTFDGDASLRRRPMSRVLSPLADMGATVTFLAGEGLAPFTVAGGSLTGITYASPVASAQVQTALLLAGLQADGKTVVAVPDTVRDHTRRMFRFIGLPHETDAAGAISVIKLDGPISPFSLDVPADISSAAFFLVAAACLPGSHLVLSDVGMNPGRRLIVDVLRSMGLSINEINQRELSGEPVADLEVAYAGSLENLTVDGAILAAGIDEIPILALAGVFGKGTLKIKDAKELRVKESDRIAAIAGNLKAAGARVTEHEDGLVIEGQAGLPGGSLWKCYDDHRLAMTGLVANLLADAPIEVDNRACTAVSYPQFEEHLKGLAGD